MSQKDDNTGKKPAVPNLSELFGDGVKLDVTARDVFAGDLSAVRRQQGDALPRPAASKGFNATQFIMLVNLIALTGILVYLVFRQATPVVIPVTPASESSAPTTAPSTEPVPQGNVPVSPAAILEKLNLGRSAAEALELAVSIQAAEAFYAAGDYYKAGYIYARLRQNLTCRTVQDEVLSDWLTLQMALSLQKTQEQQLMGELFTQALNSRSPAVRALANYNLAFIQNHNRSFLEARQRAFAALALLKTLESYLPPTVEADCYFLAAESLTRYLLRTGNMGDTLPGTLWADSQPIYALPVTDQQQLIAMLTEGMDVMRGAATLTPKIDYDPQRALGAQWTAYAMDAPLGELLKLYAVQAKIDLHLGNLTSGLGSRKTAVYLPQVDRHWLAETAVGATGLLWRFDGQSAGVYDLADFQWLDQMRLTLIQESIAMWQRFLLRYRGDHRTPNAHYCLGVLNALGEQNPTALGEYKLLATQFPNNPLAPYALLNASKIKTNLRDYTGAQSDLNELLIRYPNCKILDEAMLYLAEATMNSGRFDEAAEMFRRVYYLDVNQQARRMSAFGLGRCAFERGRYEEAAKWLTEAISNTLDKNDSRLATACMMLGRSYVHLGNYTAASAALRAALGSRLDNSEYVQIVLELARSEAKQEQYLRALNILESIPEERLNQAESVEVMLGRAELYRMIGVPSTAISLLRRKIEFIADSQLRARMSLELAECYLQNGETTPARRELNDAMPSLPAGTPSHRAGYLMAQIAFQNARYDQAESLCQETLRLGVQDESLRQRLYGLLGSIYTTQKAYDRAALAYAGLWEQAGVP